MTPDQRISEIRARLAKATPGPWEVNIQPFESGDWSGVDHASGGVCALVDTGTAADLRLIAKAPSDLTFLLNLIERQAKALEVADRALEQADDILPRRTWIYDTFGGDDDHEVISLLKETRIVRAEIAKLMKEQE